MVTTELILIRHGQSHANVQPIIGGMRGDAGLTERGHQQAARLGRRLVAEGFRANVLYASTLPRAQQTAQYVSEAIGLAVHDDDDLQELRSGEADGMSLSEWAERWPRRGGGLQRDPFRPMAPGGESWATFVVRASAALVALVERHDDQRVVAVCHGGVIESSFYLGFGLGASGKQVAFSAENTGLTRWRYDPAADRADWTLLGFNDVQHLGSAS